MADGVDLFTKVALPRGEGPWPVVFIALLYFGLELVRALATMESGVSSGIAHMAHIGGFIAAYACCPWSPKADRSNSVFWTGGQVKGMPMRPSVVE